MTLIEICFVLLCILLAAIAVQFYFLLRVLKACYELWLMEFEEEEDDDDPEDPDEEDLPDEPSVVVRLRSY